MKSYLLLFLTAFLLLALAIPACAPKAKEENYNTAMGVDKCSIIREGKVVVVNYWLPVGLLTSVV